MRDQKEICSSCGWTGNTQDLLNFYPKQERTTETVVCPDCNSIVDNMESEKNEPCK